jgi:gamma-glutamyltranspeptidase/glutathione hydrolase
MPVQQAVEAPRFALAATPNFYKPGAEISVEIENRVPAETMAALRAMGHKLVTVPGWASIGNLQAIRIDPSTGAMTAGADPRRTMYAMGY